MKRASLSVFPPSAKTEPADLTDRLLDREVAGGQQPAEAKRARQPRRRGAGARRQSQAAPSAPPADEPQLAPAAKQASETLAEALRQAQSAAQALEQAARGAPARHHLGLRVRLDALAHHLRQVAEYAATLAGK
ncbi:MAG: hypothetical protein IT318_13245 [Anaerolineales bacterium]|nr:hypothetical protein [Anaerolineales bacterium]